MKKLVLLLFLVSATSCLSKAAGNHSSTDPNPSAVYLIHGQGELSAEDLKVHPEVVVVQTLEDLKKAASQKTALWIDKSAAPLSPEEEQWINQAPQAYDPVVLVGTSDAVYSFRDLLQFCCFMGPTDDYPRFDAPGFSVIQRGEPSEPNTPAINFLQGFDQKPTVQSILEITNALLTGTLKATPTPTFIPAATATP